MPHDVSCGGFRSGKCPRMAGAMVIGVPSKLNDSSGEIIRWSTIFS